MPQAFPSPFEGSAKARAQANVEAVRALEYSQFGAISDRDELERKLANFSGWGALSGLFDGSDPDFISLREELLELIGQVRFDDLGRSVLDSYYTPAPLISAIWGAAISAGFSGGRVLEPGCGAGYFRRFMPECLANDTKMTGVEREQIAADIAKRLHRDMNVIRSPFEDASLVDGSFDLVVGNVPFGQARVFDALHKAESQFSIHNFFLAKSIRKLRPGGLMLVVCSRFFLDSLNGAAREFIDRRAKLLGAVRLPAGTFSGVAGTEVVADVLVFQRRQLITDSVSDDAWLTVDHAPVGSNLGINTYFLDHPEHILGDLDTRSGPHGPEMTVKRAIDDGLWGDLASALGAIVDRVVAVRGGRSLQSQAVGGRALIGESAIDDPEDRLDGELIVAKHGVVAECVHVDGVRVFARTDLEGKKKQRAIGMIELAALTRKLLQAEQADNVPVMEKLRAELNQRYDRFVSSFGAASNRANQLVFRGDPRNPLVASLEVDYEEDISPAKARQLKCKPRSASWEKAPIFSRPVNAPRKLATPTTAEDALMRSLSEFGRIRLDKMQAWLGMDEDALIQALGSRMFLDPVSGDWILREIYLGGNVRAKLASAQAAAKLDERFSGNVLALEAALPEDICAADISAPINAPWLPGDVVEEFLAKILGDKLPATPQFVAGEWVLSLPPGYGDTQCKVWGTDRRSASDIIERVMNNRDLRVYDSVPKPDGGKERVFNPDATAAVQAKADDLVDAWDGWVWADPERRRRLVRLYNDTHNTHAPTKYDGSFLAEDGRLAGMSSAITLRSTQVNAIWHGICVRSTLNDHVVGAGKTFACIGQIMEMRRMGLINKAMIVVPNHLVLQWGGEAQRLYPQAKVLCAGPKDCERKNRQRLFARVATGDWDMVIIAHSSFKFISAPLDARFSMLDSMAREIAHAMAHTDEDDRQGFRRMQKRLENIRSRMKRLMEAPARDAICFDELGIDHLAIDEAQAYKNLLYFTSFHGVMGLGPADGSQQAFDLFCKGQWLQERGGAFTLLTGTPVSNTVAELFHFLRYLCYPALQDKGIHTLDAWARVFAQPTASYELGVSGEYKLVTRFQEFSNVPELMQLYRHHANVVTFDDLAASGSGWSVPRMRGGKPQMVICDQSPELAEYMDEIMDRCDSLRGKDPREDNMLKIMSDARMAALDVRMVRPGALPHQGSKVYQVAARVLREYRRWDKEKGTQLVFCDLSVPSAHAKHKGKRRFSFYDELRSILITSGIPAEEVAFIHDAKTDDAKFSLQERVRQGLVRVLIGSTAKMGTGMNVQDRLVAVHDCDAPWRPADLEQRLGRILRYGNKLHTADPEGFEIVVYRYGVERSLDARQWQILETKSKFIQTFRSGSTDRTIKDIGGETESAGAMKACLSGNPLILAHFQASTELDRLERQQKAHMRRQMEIEDRLRQTEDYAERLKAARARYDQDVATLAQYPEPTWATKNATHHDSDCSAAMETDVNQALLNLPAYRRAYSADQGALVGHYRGIEVRVWRDMSDAFIVSLCGQFIRKGIAYDSRRTLDRLVSGVGLRRRLDNVLATINDSWAITEERARQTQIDRESMSKVVGEPFRHADRLSGLKVAVRDLAVALSAGLSALPDQSSPVAFELVAGAAAETIAPEITVDDDDLEIPSIIEGPMGAIGSVPGVFYDAEPEQQSLFG